MDNIRLVMCKIELDLATQNKYVIVPSVLLANTQLTKHDYYYFSSYEGRESRCNMLGIFPL